jgi:hypothetical protein
MGASEEMPDLARVAENWHKVTVDIKKRRCQCGTVLSRKNKMAVCFNCERNMFKRRGTRL